MEIFLIRALQFILAISLLVLLHEGGHFLFSKLFGVRVEKFFIFFDPSIGKWNGSLFRFKPRKSDTTYGIGWLPLGGYCKISGMVDESLDMEQMKKPAQPWEFRSKPAWQRLLIMVGGVLMNFIVAFLIYAMILFYWGDSYIATKDMTLGMKFNADAKALGFQDHDILLGTDLGAFKDYSADMFRDLAEAKRVDVLRNGKQVSIALPGNLNLLDMLKAEPRFVEPFYPLEVDSVLEKTPAATIGLKKGDQILSINGKAVDSFNEFSNELGRLEDIMSTSSTRADSLKTRAVTLTVKRAETAKTDTLQTTLTPELKLGFSPTNVLASYKVTHLSYGFWESFPAGIQYGYNVLAGYVGDLKYLFSSDGVKSLGGFGAIGSMFPAQWDWYMFWKMTAFLSIILAFMNILPIPALDGGYVLFLLLEMITRRKFSDEFMEKAVTVGFFLLLALMVVANLNDVLRWIGLM